MHDVLQILVVDDDPAMAMTLVDILQAEGYEAEAAHTGLDALQRLAEDHFDCLLTDIRMPGLNGLELLHALKPDRPGLPVVFMTPYSSPGLAAQAVQQGAIAVVGKPIDINLLLRFLSALRRQPCVIIVTSDPESVEAIEERLRTQDIAVSEFSEAPPLVYKGQRDERVLLLDLPEDEALRVLPRVREECPDVPVLLVPRSEEMYPSQQACQKLGAYACLQKPFDSENLLQLLAAMHLKQLRRMFDQEAWNRPQG